MSTIEVQGFSDSIVLRFGTVDASINAYTLASTITGIADSLKEANYHINHGFEVEVVVLPLAKGSFIAKLKQIPKSAKNLFSKSTFRDIALAVVAAHLYQLTLAPDMEVKVEVSKDLTIIRQGDKEIIIPNDVYAENEKLKKSEKFNKGFSDAVKSIKNNEEVKSLSIAPHESQLKNSYSISREEFHYMNTDVYGVLEDEKSRKKLEIVEISIIKAILERSKRKWEFVWRGEKISAPITDDHFYNIFFAHDITIAPGDTLEVELEITQERNDDTGIYINKRFEVVRVINHNSRPKQKTIEF